MMPPSTPCSEFIRQIYLTALNPEFLPDKSLPIESELHRFDTGQPGGSLEALRAEAEHWTAEETGRYRALLVDQSNESIGVLIRRAALGSAPLALVSGSWLQWLSNMAEADDPLMLKILELYASDVGAGQPHASRGSAYFALLRRLRLAEHARPVAQLALHPAIADEAFYLPSLLLLMSRIPEDFRPAILGADLCLRVTGLPPMLGLAEVLPDGTEATGLDLGQNELARSEDLFAAWPDLEQEAVTGFQWALAALRAWSEALHTELQAALDPAWEMAELVQTRAREGAVYHQDHIIQGQPLSQWLKEARQDPWPLLGVLASSRQVRPGHPERSSLINGLIAESGPMFRVFSPAEVQVISRWITALDGPEPQQRPSGKGAGPSLTPLFTSLTGKADLGTAPGSLREAYFHLQRRTVSPAVLDFARTYVRGWLSRSGHELGRAQSSLPTEWSMDGLRPWLADQHDQHAAEFEEGADLALPTREAVIDSSIQLAPLTMIDGAWLQGFTDYELAASDIGFSLFSTYWDELGNGQLALNHPRIYRQLAMEMASDLPPTGSWEFAHWPGFRDESFELPVYWLSIGRFPRTCLPEVLGLNLAMELSGVGGSYRRARIGLKKYGFSTRFVDIHNTIDNVATGHSAWAADAIDSYMVALSGPEPRAQAWERVRIGYRSLNPPTSSAARRAERRGRRAATRAS
jgi:Iron-containing redox enzyme